MINNGLSLENLYHVLKKNDNSIPYLNLTPQGIAQQKRKITPLDQIFRKAAKQIETGFNKAPRSTDKEIARVKAVLSLLKEAGEERYAYYCARTNSWFRRGIKLISNLVPACLAKLLPNLYPFNLAQKIKQSEMAMKSSFEDYAAVFVNLADKIKKTENQIKAASEASEKLAEEVNLSPILINFPLAEEKPALKMELDIRKNWQIIYKNQRERPPFIENYTGPVATSISHLKEFSEQLTKHENFKPSSLELAATDAPFDDSFINSLEGLSKKVPSIHLSHLKCLDLGKLSEKSFELFLKLSSLRATQPLKSWKLPPCAAKMTFQQLSLLLQRFPVKELDLDFFSTLSERLVVDHLAAWNKHGLLKSVSSLKINQCTQLTTDALSELRQMTSLTKLEAKQMKKGKQALPKFSNPFELKIYIEGTKLSKEMLAQYTGPSSLAAIFQIPAARLGCKNVFNAQHHTLDPKSVAFWLNHGDYNYLSEEKNIKKILTDNSIYIHDDNLIGFFSRFPKVEEASLWNCPGITQKGIDRLRQQCPTIQKIDFDPSVKHEKLIMEIDPSKQLKECQKTQEKPSDEPMSQPNYLQSRMVIELFGNQLPEQAEIISHPVTDPLHPRYCDAVLPFQTKDNEPAVAEFHIRKDELYPFLTKEMRPGGLSFPTLVPIVNQNVTAEACGIIVDWIRTNHFETPVSWQTPTKIAGSDDYELPVNYRVIADAIELSNPLCLNLPDLHQKLLFELHQVIRKNMCQLEILNKKIPRNCSKIELVDELVCRALQLDDKKSLEIITSKLLGMLAADPSLVQYMQMLRPNLPQLNKACVLAEQYQTIILQLEGLDLGPLPNIDDLLLARLFMIYEENESFPESYLDTYSFNERLAILSSLLRMISTS